jgi:hypothetical protein
MNEVFHRVHLPSDSPFNEGLRVYASPYQDHFAINNDHCAEAAYRNVLIHKSMLLTLISDLEALYEHEYYQGTRPILKEEFKPLDYAGSGAEETCVPMVRVKLTNGDQYEAANVDTVDMWWEDAILYFQTEGETRSWPAHMVESTYAEYTDL